MIQNSVLRKEKSMKTALNYICLAAQLIHDETFKMALDRARSVFRIIEQASSSLDEKTSTELRKACTELIKSLEAVSRSVDDLAREEEECRG